MKYLITESQIKNLVDKFLEKESKKWVVYDIEDGEFTIWYNNVNKIISYRISYDDEHVYGKYVFDYLFYDRIKSLFGLNMDKTAEYIVDFLNKEFNTNVKYNDWDFIEEEI